MRKCVVIPDSFKGTMRAADVAGIIKEVLERNYPQVGVRAVPMADGGEGTLDSFLYAMEGRRVEMDATDPYGNPLRAAYGIFDDTAVIESAQVVGLPLCVREDPSVAGSFGIGQLMADAIERGCKRLVLGIGGTGTNDAGAGMAAALGTVFYDDAGEEFIPVGGTLGRVSRVENDMARRKLAGVQVVAMCDVDSPLYGAKGASQVFAPQKGADPHMVRRLDEQMEAFAHRVAADVGVDMQMPGGGAGGGLAGGAHAFLGATLERGTDVVLDMVGFDEMLDGCDVVITGEGKLDEQSLTGKAVMGVAERADAQGVAVMVVAGCVTADREQLARHGIVHVEQADPGRGSFEQIRRHAREDLAAATQRLCTEELLGRYLSE